MMENDVKVLVNKLHYAFGERCAIDSKQNPFSRL